MKKILSVLLVLMLCVGMLPTAAFADGVAPAADDPTHPAPVEDSTMYLSKVYDPDTGILTLESYAKGAMVEVETVTKVPSDIILVLDQSGSMAYDFNGKSDASYADSRQKALKDAANAFIDAVAADYDEQANHRMAIVTFNSRGSTKLGWTYVDAAGQTKLKNTIGTTPDGGLGSSPSGGTQVQTGLQQANTLMDNRQGNNTGRQKVVIVFTDGVPGNKGFDADVATSAISSAKTLKDNGAIVYAVGIFNGAAEMAIPTTKYFTDNGAKASDVWQVPSSDTAGQEWHIYNGLFAADTEINISDAAAGNRFLSYLSSDYPSATEFGAEKVTGKGGFLGIQSYEGYSITSSAAGSAAGYYLTANNAAGLTNIFKSIADSTLEGGASIQLGTSTVVKDVVSPYFQIDADNAVMSEAKAYSVAYNNGNWGTAHVADFTPTVAADGKTVSVTGFDFSAHWCGQNAPDGQKLVIEIPIKPLDESAGLNLPTNVDTSGIYDGNDNLVKLFPVPTVDINKFKVIREDSDGNELSSTWIHMDNVDDPDSFNVTKAVPEDNYPGLTSGKLYGGMYSVDGEGEKTYANCGLNFAPVAGGVYHLREVSPNYLQPSVIYVYKEYAPYKIEYIYMVTAIDEAEYYSGVGFTFTRPNEDGTTVTAALDNDEAYNQILIDYENRTDETYSVTNLFPRLNDDDWLYIAAADFDKDADGYAAENKTFDIVPYYVTNDGVKVTGRVDLTVATNSGVGLDSDGYTMISGANKVIATTATATNSFSLTAHGLTTFSMFRVEPIEIADEPAEEVEEDIEEPTEEVEEPTEEVEEPTEEVEEPTEEVEEPTEEVEEPAEDVEEPTEKVEEPAEEVEEPAEDVEEPTEEVEEPAEEVEEPAEDVEEPAEDVEEVPEEESVAEPVEILSVSAKAVKTGVSKTKFTASVTLNSADVAKVGFIYSVKNSTKDVEATLVSDSNGEATFTANWSESGYNARSIINVTPYFVLEDGTVVYGEQQSYSYAALLISTIANNFYR